MKFEREALEDNAAVADAEPEGVAAVANRAA
jgi:hypothetical protein